MTSVRALLFAFAAFAVIVVVSVVIGDVASRAVERVTMDRLAKVFDTSEYRWVTVRADGTLVHLSGEAPLETARFGALEEAATVVGANRIRDAIRIKPPEGDPIPEFQLEILRDKTTVSIAGLIPSGTSRTRLRQALSTLGPDIRLRDLSEMVDGQPDREWGPTLDAALVAATTLSHTRISLKSCDISITGVAQSTVERDALTAQLRRDAGECLTLVQIKVPRQLINPFLFDLELTEGKVILRDCTAQTATARDRIQSRLAEMGLPSENACRLGLGAPSENWADAVIISIDHLGMLGRGRILLADTEVFLEGTATSDADAFGEVSAALETALPDMFSVEATLPPITGPEISTELESLNDPLLFVARQDIDGSVLLRGPMPNDDAWAAVEAFAGSVFGTKRVKIERSLVADLPDGWPANIMNGLEAFAILRDGKMEISGTQVSVAGESLLEDANAIVTRMLSASLPDAKLAVQVTFDAEAAAEAKAPRPQDCLHASRAILAETQIVFAPSSANIDAESTKVLDALAEILRPCGKAVFEIGGYTDNRGTDTLNLSLSKARAESVLDALLARGVPLEKMVSAGYGEADPITTNETEEGRAANRRIELRIVEPENPETADGQN